MKVRLQTGPPEGYADAPRVRGWCGSNPPREITVVGDPLHKGNYRIVILSDPAWLNTGKWALIRSEYVSIQRPEGTIQPAPMTPRQKHRPQLSLF